MLQVTKPHIRIMRLVGYIHHRLLTRPVVQIIRTEIDAVIIAVRTAMRHNTPHLILLIPIQRSEKLNYIPLKSLRGHVPGRIGHRITGVIQIDHLHARRQVPFIEPAQCRLLVNRITEIGLLTLFPDTYPLIKFLKTRTLSHHTLRTHQQEYQAEYNPSHHFHKMYSSNFAQSYKKKCTYAKKYVQIAFFCQKIWSCQKNVVPLHAFLTYKPVLVREPKYL